MSDKPGLQIDDDWKRQAQEEKRKLAEQQKEQEAARAQSATSSTSSRSSKRDIPVASLDALVSQTMTQALYYLGELSEDERGQVDLDMAKYQIDLLNVLEDKCKGNLSTEEQAGLDSALYDLRMRYVSIATQMIR
jgi:hypothetical protein